MSMKAKASNAKLKFQSWATTDAEEREKRRERASIEPMKVKAVDVADGFGTYEVFHPAADRRMDAWWERKGENEIDLVCDDEVAGRLDFFEVKRDSKCIDLDSLQKKSMAFFAKNPRMAQRKVSFGGLSIQDM